MMLSFIFIPDQTLKSQPAQEDQEMANWIMKKVVEKSLENERIKRQYITYDKHQITEDLTTKPIKTKTEIFQIYGQNGQSMERLIESGGRPVKERGRASQLDFTNTLAN